MLNRILLSLSLTFIIASLAIALAGCGEVEEFIENIGDEVTDPVNESVDDAIDDVEGSADNSDSEVEAPQATLTSFFIPDNCSKPPKNISQFDGFKCIASTTRGGSVVCLLPYQFTWAPYKTFTDHHGVTMNCNINDDHFDKVELVRKNGKVISLVWDKCQNWVGTAQGKIGRQHFRNESIKWSNIQGKLDRIEMTKNGQKTCLKF